MAPLFLSNYIRGIIMRTYETFKSKAVCLLKFNQFLSDPWFQYLMLCILSRWQSRLYPLSCHTKTICWCAGGESFLIIIGSLWRVCDTIRPVLIRFWGICHGWVIRTLDKAVGGGDVPDCRGPWFATCIQHTKQFAHNWNWPRSQCMPTHSYVSSIHKWYPTTGLNIILR